MINIKDVFTSWEIIERNIDRCIVEKNNKHPVLFIIDGGLSTGKTTFAINIMDMINLKHEQKEVDLFLPANEINQYALGGEDFVKKLRMCYEKGLPVITYDEAGDFSRKGALTKFNKTLNRVFDTFRAYQIIVILVLPNFSKLSKDIFDNKIPTMLIHLKKRHKNYGVAHFYDLKSMYYIMNNMKSDIFPEASYSKVYPNFRTKFKDLTPERSKQLDKLSTFGKKDLLEMAEVRLQGLMSYNDLALQLEKSPLWVKTHIKALAIKPQTIIKRKLYFEQEIFLRLKPLIKRK
jgi:hypothetical protein